ncbi:MAG TPA: chloride channel protein [Casimicrobiaceae bacterium]|nr:chloride channel protein [Casimicrobiaceae bacterium]
MAWNPKTARLPIARRARHVWLSPALWNRRFIFLVGSILVGLIAVAFALAATLANLVLQRMLEAWRWSPFVVAPMGFAAIAYAGRRFFAGAQGSGIPQTIAALTHSMPGYREGLLSLRVAIGKIALTLLGLLAGASIGREGPSVQIGAAIMYAMSRLSSFPHEAMKRGLILAGGAAGVAAAFNAPLAGVVFAIEEMSRSFSQRTSGIVMTAVIVAGIVSLALLGDYAYFGHTRASVDLASGWLAVLLCGAVGGLVGGGFSRILIEASHALPGRLGALRATHPYAFAAACGLVLAVLGFASDDTIYGTGYGETRAILEGGATPQSFGILKLAATLVSYASGIPGGIFSPSLAVGAGLGQNLALLLPAAPLAAVVILGMVAYFSGVVQAPLTAFVIVVEMTRDADMALPLFAASLIGSGVSRLICPRPVYKALAKGFRPGAIV